MKVVNYHTHQTGTMPALAVKFGGRTIIYAPEANVKEQARQK